MFPGVYVTHNADITWRERVEGAVLARGPGAVASLGCALHLWGLSEQQPQIITLAEPVHTHRHRRLPGVRTRRRRRLVPTSRHGIPVTALPQTVLDVLALPHTTPDEIAGLVTRALSSRRVTSAALADELTHHSLHPAREVIGEVLRAAEEGLGSAAEVRYAARVEEAHGLPRMQRQVPLDGRQAARDGCSRRLDFRDPRTGLVVEVDGELYHRDRWQQDRARDRQAVGRGDVVLRAGWVDVVATPCVLAADIAAALAARGWKGRVRPCSRECSLPRDARLRAAGAVQV